MAAVKRGLNKGKGLSALIDTGDNKISKAIKSAKEEGLVYMNISKIEPNRDQPRKKFDEDQLQELADSIKQHGVITPLTVTPRDGYYEIIAGERRWRASTIAGLKEVPVVIRDLTEQQIVEIALIENLQRVDLNPIEEALAYRKLIDDFNMTQDQVADKVSKRRPTITNSLRLLKLTPEVQQMLIDEKLTEGHARALISIEDAEKQLAIAEQVFDNKLSVREIEKLVKNYGKPAVKPKHDKDEQLATVYKDIQEKIKSRLNTKVALKVDAEGKGKIEIEFYSSEDLERILDKIKK